jgi:hypothetical protein
MKTQFVLALFLITSAAPASGESIDCQVWASRVDSKLEYSEDTQQRQGLRLVSHRFGSEIAEFTADLPGGYQVWVRAGDPETSEQLFIEAQLRRVRPNGGIALLGKGSVFEKSFFEKDPQTGQTIEDTMVELDNLKVWEARIGVPGWEEIDGIDQYLLKEGVLKRDEIRTVRITCKREVRLTIRLFSP